MHGCVTHVTDLACCNASNQAFNNFTSGETAMKQNVGNIERILRIAVGLVLIGLAATDTIGMWGWIGIAPLATGLIGWCPPYALFGWNTCSMKNKT